jgi:hypothetical protein
LSTVVTLLPIEALLSRFVGQCQTAFGDICTQQYALQAIYLIFSTLEAVSTEIRRGNEQCSNAA